MGYRKTLEKAGAIVHCFKEFGSYQGTWLAKVTFENETGWVEGYYGSCSGCDAFQAEFGYFDLPTMKDGKWYRNNNWWDEDDVITEEEALAETKNYNDRMCNFGKTYLTRLYSQNEIEQKASENIDWDSSVEDMLKFVKDNSI